MTGYLTYDANVARLDDLQRRAGRRLAISQASARDARPVTLRRTTTTAADRAAGVRLRPRWAHRAA